MVSADRSYWDVLELPKDASMKSIKKAFRKLAAKYHPDRCQESEEICSEKFAELNRAYQVLSDDQNRRIYNQYGEEGLKQYETNPRGWRGGLSGHFFGGQSAGFAASFARQSGTRFPLKLNTNTIGLSVGGAKDINNFRDRISSNKMPVIDSITYQGIINEYYFDTTTTTQDNIKYQQQSTLFYPTYSYAQIHNYDSQNDGAMEYYMTLGLNSNIKQDEFKRKHLNLIILLDVSGSMSGWKIDSAKKAIESILQQLNDNDRLGIVTFESGSKTFLNMKNITDLDMATVKEIVRSIHAAGGTNFESGYRQVMNVYETMNIAGFNNDGYDNRVIVLTDAMFNQGSHDGDTLLSMISNAAEDRADTGRIYTTFIGIGLDFNAGMIEKISQTRGCNYYSVKNAKEFEDKMNEEFEYMVTPLVFNVVLRLECDSCVIDKIYGSDTDCKSDGEFSRIHTLFPSQKSNETDETRGGIQLIKLIKDENKMNITSSENDGFEVLLEVTYEDRDGKKYRSVQNVLFDADGLSTNNFYDNLGIRKAILLCKYVDVIKRWIETDGDGADTLVVSEENRQMFRQFQTYFANEMEVLNDESLRKELDLLSKLIDL